MKQQNKWLGSVAGVLVASAISTATMAGVVPIEQPLLTPWDGYGTTTVDFTDISVEYTNGKKGRKGTINDDRFFAESTSTSQFSLDGKGYDNQVFEGSMYIDLNVTSKGYLKSGGTFGIYSNDTNMFGTDHLTEYNCNKQGKSCSTGQLVYGGSISDFGWSGSEGYLDFEITNMSGWALDVWVGSGGSAGQVEHIRLNIDCATQNPSDPSLCFDLNGASSVKSFSATADGFAVVPVPAAAWLFGSGLLGLVGFARRKRA